MGLPNKPFERTRPETIATPVNKPREAQSLWELPGLRPSGGAQSCWPRYYIYNYIILYTIIYRAPWVANGNNHFLLHAAVHPGLHSTEFDGWTLICCLRYTCQWPRCWTLIGCHHEKFKYISTRANLSRHKSSWTRSPVHGESVVRQVKTCRRFSLAKNLPDMRLYVHFVWDLVAPSYLVWTHKSFPTGQSWPKSPAQSLCPVFLRNKPFLSKTGLKHLSETA